MKKKLEQKIKDILRESISVKEGLIESQIPVLVEISELITAAVKNNKKILIFGNGGSAADSQHIAAELVGRFKKERRPVPAIALTTNTSTLTAVSNDYGYHVSFRRQLEALAVKGDIAIAISTSGNAENVYEALRAAKTLELKIVTFTGRGGGRIAELADCALRVPSDNTPRIQESHITAGHIICELVEEEL